MSIAERFHEFCCNEESRLRRFAASLYENGMGENAIEMQRIADRFKLLAAERDAAAVRMRR